MNAKSSCESPQLAHDSDTAAPAVSTGIESAGPHMIETPEALSRFARILRRKRVVAVDLEADSMYHFQERVCLIQVATRQESALIDPLAVPDLSELAPIFANPRIEKVFHGADYDVRSLHRDFGIVIHNLFDTQIAARFLGFSETGLEAVLRREFGVSMDKKYQKKDWSQRPLPPEMLAYAAEDTTYLIPLARRLQKRLLRRGRLEWVREECELLSQVRAAEDDGPLFLRFKGAGKLPPRDLAVLEGVLRFRRSIAKRKDRPPFKVFGNNAVKRIVETRPATPEAVEKSGAFSRKQLHMYARPMAKIVAEALEIPDPQLPVYPRRSAPRLSPRAPQRVKSLKAWRDERCAGLDMDPALVLNKSQMTAISARNPENLEELAEVEELREWQRTEFGPEILAVLERLRERAGQKKTKKRRRKRRPRARKKPAEGKSDDE
jgi:ribonuclease D